jgi:NDP-sugar pyrophosphorylase family protein
MGQHFGKLVAGTGARAVKVVMPMAGQGSRFKLDGADLPKPLAPVAGVPMFIRALTSLGTDHDTEVIFVALKEHQEKHDLRALISRLVPNPYQLVLVDDVTDGQLCTVLAARQLLSDDEDVLIMSSDTVVVSSIGHDIRNRRTDCEGIISTCHVEGEQWSFAQTAPSGRVIRVAEKQRISPNASTGLYYFSNTNRFLDYADLLITRQNKTRGEYYVIPVYQEYVEDGLLVTLSFASELWDMGTVEAMRRYESYIKTKPE